MGLSFAAKQPRAVSGVIPEIVPEAVSEGTLLEAPLPLVSVVIPAYNAEGFIARTLASVLAQTYESFEVWVVNDGSTDRTAVIVKSIAQQDTRVKLLTQANAGVAAARNSGIRHAQGTLIATIDADDLWSPDLLAKQVACFLSAPASIGLVYAWSVDIDEQDQPLRGFHAAQITGRAYSTLLCHNFFGNASCTMMRRSLLLQLGGYSEDFQAQNAYGCEDWDLYLRMAEVCQFKVVPEFLVGYRKLQQSMSYNYDRMARSHALLLQRVEQRHPHLSKGLHGLSRSGLYLYFAHQAGEQGQASTALRWLRAAMQSHLAPWLRLSTYHLGLRMGLKSLRPVGFGTSPSQPPASVNKSSDKSSAKPDITATPWWVQGSTAPQQEVTLKLWLTNALHSVLSSGSSSGSSSLGNPQ